MFKTSDSFRCSVLVFRPSVFSTFDCILSRILSCVAPLLLILGVALCGQVAHAQTAVFSGTQGLNFGTTAVASTSPAQALTFTFTNATAATIGAPLPLTQGACSSANAACHNATSNALDFAVASGGSCDTTTAYGTSAATSCTVNVTFTPTAPGQRNGAVELTNSSGAVIATAYVYGTGTGPMVGFPPATIKTVAGNGANGFGGDGGPATSAQISSPENVALDGAGSIYIADAANHRVRKVTPQGTMTTVAGNGTIGFGGDGGPATSAQLSSPVGVAIDSAGNLYIVDADSNTVRKVIPSGTITTVAGNDTAGYSGDNGPATSAQLSFPEGVAVDTAGNLYIADTLNNVIRKVSLSGTITSFVGNGTLGFSGDGGQATSAQLSNPFGVAASAGNLYIADFANDRVREVNLSTGIITTAAGNGTQGFSGDNGPATSAELSNPTSVAVDGVGNLYIADINNNLVRKVNTSGTITTVAGNGSQGFGGDNGPATGAKLFFPQGVAVDGVANLFVADLGNRRIREVNISSAPSLSFATTNVGSVGSNTVTVQVANIGNGPLTFESTPTVSLNFGLAANTCISGTSIPVGGSCDVEAFFAPTVPGNPLTGSIILTDNAFNAASAGFTQTITLSGVAPVPPPVVNRVLPSAGSPSGATVVTITGNYFTGATSVTFGGVVAPSFVVVSDTQITTVSPAGTLGSTVDIVVTTPQGSSGTSAADKFQYAIALAAAATSPSVTLALGTAANFTPVTATNGVPPYSYAISSGTLPTGLNINASTGAISGTPTASVTNAGYTVTVTDAAAETASAGFTLTVNQTAQSINFTQPASPVVYGVAPISLSATANSGLSVALSVASGPGTISGSTLTVTGVGTIVIAANQPGNAIYSAAAQVTRSLVVNSSTLNISANNTSKVYGTANPVFTGTVAGQQNGDTFAESFSTTATQSSPVNTYAIVPNVTGTNLGDYTVSAANGTLTVTQAASSVSLIASASSINAGQTLALTATVIDATPNSIGTPTGTVVFLDGATQLGTVALTNGAASLTVNSLAPNVAHSLTATYAGDTNFSGSGVSVPVAITVGGSLDFILGAPSSVDLSTTAGGTVTTNFDIAPLSGSYAGPVSFSTTGLPTGATASFSPDSIAANTSTQQAVALSVQLPKTTASNVDNDPWRPAAPVALGVLLLPFATVRRLRKSLSGRITMLVLLFAVGFAGGASLSGCSGGGPAVKTPTSQTYTVTVTATAGSLTHSFQINITVQ
jgi:hypothetical protein